MRTIQQWQVYCNDEASNIVGYIDAQYGSPLVCFNNNTHTIDTSKSIIIESINDNISRFIYEWDIYCDTEKTNVIGFTSKPEHPQICFNNNTHVISKKPTLIKKIQNRITILKEEFPQTGGYFKANSIKMVCPVGLSTHDFSYPYDISVMSIVFTTSSEHTGDSLENLTAPNTTIGSIISDVNVSDSVITVSSTVFEYIQIGFYVNITDGTNNNNLGRVLSKNIHNNTITVETPAINSFLVSTPTYVQMSVKTIDNYIIGEPSRYEIGKDKIGGSHVPANTVIRVNYTNNGVSSKNFYAVIEHLY